MPDDSLLIFADADVLARASAVEIMQLAAAAISVRGVFTLALAGGSTPKKLYSLLGTDPAFRAFPWEKTHLFFGDERHVPPNDADSNFLMVKKTLLASGLVPESNVHRVQAELPDGAQAAVNYEQDLQAFFGEALRRDGFPVFDLVLLGMGPDGHTASLFPGSPGLAEKTRWVISNWVEKFKSDRITLTYPVLNAARVVHLLIAGADKAEMIAEVLGTRADELAYPVQSVRPTAGTKIWMLDEAAAARLPKNNL